MQREEHDACLTKPIPSQIPSVQPLPGHLPVPASACWRRGRRLGSARTWGWAPGAAPRRPPRPPPRLQQPAQRPPQPPAARLLRQRRRGRRRLPQARRRGQWQVELQPQHPAACGTALLGPQRQGPPPLSGAPWPPLQGMPGGVSVGKEGAAAGPCSASWHPHSVRQAACWLARAKPPHPPTPRGPQA